MTILVIGRTGQLSRSLQEAAVVRGVKLVVLGRAECDLLSAASIAGALDRTAPAVVVNPAGYTAVAAAEGDEAAAFALNADGPERLAAACAARGIALIHLSSDYVFDGRKKEPYREDDPTGPLNVYGRSKLEGEARVAALLPRHVILRTSWLHSPFGDNFVRTMLSRARTEPVLRVVADQSGAPTYAPHLAVAVLAIAARIAGTGAPADEAFGIIHATNAGATTWHGFAVECLRVAADYGWPQPPVQPITTAAFPTPARRPANSLLDTLKLRDRFGLTLPGWAEGVADCVRRIATAEGYSLRTADPAAAKAGGRR